MELVYSSESRLMTEQWNASALNDLTILSDWAAVADHARGWVPEVLTPCDETGTSNLESCDDDAGQGGYGSGRYVSL